MKNFNFTPKYIKADILGSIGKAALGFTMLAAGSAIFVLPAMADEWSMPDDYNRFKAYNQTVFYDGYLTSTVVDADKEDGIVRFTNYHYTRPLDTEAVLNLGQDLQMEVLINAMCDNYDRMGRVMLAFPQSGSATYDPESTERIEIARFITPFMNKNRIPWGVPYIYEIDDVRQILSDSQLLEGRDVWLEVEVFGVPYAANTQVAGCGGHNDVFAASVTFGGHLPVARAHDRLSASEANVVLTPINVSKCEIFGNVNLNNYRPEATDTIGTTSKTYRFNVDSDLEDARINLILTNHGAAENGEEYVRRQHLVYVDGEIALVYTPGGVSCEPYRIYNTQPNGIYMNTPQDDWEEWNNWCPGQAVPTRRISLGALKAGEHSLMIRVPDAEFYGADGDFRPSAYLQGVKKGSVNAPSEVEGIFDDSGISMKVVGKEVRFPTDANVSEIRVYSYDGRLLEGRYNPGSSYSFAHLSAGQYIIVATSESGHTSFVKVLN